MNNDMATKRKYGNQKVYHNDITFDSILEFNVYKKLVMFVNLYNLDNPLKPLNLQVHYPIKINKIKGLPPVTWYCDFVIFNHHHQIVLMIEAKGMATLEFKYKMQMLTLNHSELIPAITIVFSGENTRKKFSNYRLFNSVSLSKFNCEYIKGLIKNG